MIKGLISIAESDISLRPYQVNSKKQIYEAWLSVQSVLFQMPTGTGKTRLFASIIKDIRNISVQEKVVPQPRILVLAHRTELIEQIVETLQYKYQITCGVIKSGIPENMEAIVQVASVQSLSRRLTRWGKIPFGFIIIDEAHHALAKTYLSICTAFLNVRILGVTATPYRLSSESFRRLFDRLITSCSVQQFIEMGYLSKFQYYSIKPSSQLHSELDNIRHFGANGDYAERDLMMVCDKSKIRAQLIKAYNDFAKGKKGIVYTINKMHNQHVAQQYAEIGARVATIDSDTPSFERKQIVSDFKKGKLDVICNVNIFSEGFDCPDLEFIQLARPTLSLSLYLQQVGRALRKSDNKEYALILDNVGSYNKFGLPNYPRDWNKYFNGFGGSLPSRFLNRTTNSLITQKVITESDEEMICISSTDCVVDGDDNEDKYTINDILATRQEYPIGFRKYVYTKEKESILSRGKTESLAIFDLYKSFANSYSSLDSYIEDTWSMSYQYDNDKTALNILENTYLFKANDKYGICRLKEACTIAELLSKDHIASIPIRDYFDIILDPIFDNIEVPNSIDCFVAKKDGRCGVINGSDLTEVIPFKFDEIIEVGLVTNYIVQKGSKEGVFDKDGAMLIPVKYDEVFPSLLNTNNYSCRYNGRFALILNGQLIYKLNHRVEKLTDQLYVYRHSTKHNKDNNIVYIADYNGNILMPLGARKIFLTNNEDEICLEFDRRHILLYIDLTLKTSLINGLYPEREAVFQAQRERQNKEALFQAQQKKHKQEDATKARERNLLRQQTINQSKNAIIERNHRKQLKRQLKKTKTDNTQQQQLVHSPQKTEQIISKETILDSNPAPRKKRPRIVRVIK